MAEKILNTRIQLKGDTYNNWSTKNPVLLANEVAVVSIASSDSAVVGKPGVYFKVGDGTNKFNDLPFASGLAGDVYSWAKAEEKPQYSASEITGIDDYIAQYVNDQMGISVDTDTQYKIVKVDDYNYKLQSKGKTDAAWVDVADSAITIPKYDDTQVKEDIEALKTSVGNIDVSTQITDAVDTAKTELIGTAEDTADSDTIKGAKKYTDDKIATLTTTVGEKVASVTKADDSVTIGGTATAPTVAVAIDSTAGNALNLVEGKGLRVEVPEVTIPEYTITKLETAETGYSASYQLTKDGTQVGTTINIPKDYLVKSASIKVSTGSGDASGLPSGTKYIDFVVNTTEGSGNESHIYLNVNDLVDVYTGGNGIEISASNEISVTVVADNGLSVDANGIAMAVATTETAGAMSAEDKTKLDGLHAIATSGNVNDLVQTEGDVLILNCGNATL